MCCAPYSSLPSTEGFTFSDRSASMSHVFHFARGQEIKQCISEKSSLCPGFRPHRAQPGINIELCFPLWDVLSSTFKKQGYASFPLSKQQLTVQFIKVFLFIQVFLFLVFWWKRVWACAELILQVKFHINFYMAVIWELTLMRACTDVAHMKWNIP